MKVTPLPVNEVVEMAGPYEPAILTETTMWPMPFIVGSPRSGTTLLRLMLDAHSLLAIPPETGFIPALGVPTCSSDLSVDKFFEIVTSFSDDAPVWHDFQLAAEDFRRELHRLSPFTSSEGLRCFYRMYARRFDKPRYGDKTPTYCRCLPMIEQLLPEAAFIHIIRDGRDATLSPAGDVVCARKGHQSTRNILARQRACR